MHILELEKKDLKQVYVAYKSFLRIFQEEFPDPGAAIKNASPAVVFQVLQALHKLHIANSGITSKKAIDYYNRFINALKTKSQEFLKDISSVDEAVQKYKTQEDDSWILFEMLGFNITDNPEKKPTDQVFADFIIAIYKKLALTDEQILKNRRLREQNNSSNNAKKNSSNKNHKKKVGDNSSETNTNIPNNAQEPTNVLLKEILVLKPTTDSVNSLQWQGFFMQLCKAMVKHMPYQNKDIESYDLMMCNENDEYYKTLVKDAIISIPADHEQRQLLSFIIGKFNDSCIECKHTPLTFSMGNVRDVFSNDSEKIWNARANSTKTKEHFFDSLFSKDYLSKLKAEQRYGLRVEFLKALEMLSSHIATRTVLLEYCAQKLAPAQPLPSLNTSATQTVYQTSPQLIKETSKQDQASAAVTAGVKPGQRNEAWDKFIEKVYMPFSKANSLWEKDLSSEQKLAKLQPMLTQFKEDFPEEKDRAQAQRFFISFVNSEDCKFADGANDYAWLFIEEMIPQSTTATLSQRDLIRDLKKKIAKENETYKKAETLIKSFN
ncbi:MAG: hypothetical protein WC748_03910 [Legionellales bacterium]